MKISHLRPSQPCVGFGEVLAKMHRGIDHLQDPIPIVKGPDGNYIVDHHHEVSALHMLGEEEVHITILHDLSTLPIEHFWPVMRLLKLCYLIDHAGQRISPDRLPKHVSDLTDDPYRSLAWQVRHAGGYRKTMQPFAEFRWAAFFRRVGIESDDIESAVKMAHSWQATHLPGFIGPAHG